MASGYYHKTGGAKTTWATTGNWWTTATGTTSSGAGPNGAGQAAYIGASNMTGVNSYLSLGTAITLSSLLIGSNYNVGTTTIVGTQITFAGTFSDSSLNGIVLYPGADSLTIGQGWISGEGTRLYFNQSLPSITNNSSNSISLNDADDPIYNTTPSVGSLTFKTNGAGNIFIGKSISNSNGLATGNLFQVKVDSTGSGWTYFGNQSPYYEVTTYGKVLLYINAGNFAFNHNRARRGDTNTFSEGITLGTTFRGANQQINLDAWIEYLTTSRINFGPNGTGSDPVNLNYFGSANATFGSNSASNVMSGPSSGTITHTLNIQGSVFTINGNIVSNTAVAHSNVIKNGNGTLVLNGSSSAFASYTQNAGITRVGNASALGSGTVTLNGGTLSSNSATGYVLNNAINIGGNVTIGDSTALAGSAVTGYISFAGSPAVSSTLNLNTFSDLEFGGNLAGSSNITKTGNSGIGFVGQGTSTFSGGLTVNSGVAVCGYWNSGVCTQLNAASFIELNGPGNGRIWYRGATDTTVPTTLRGAGGIYSMNMGANSVTLTGNLSAFTGYIECYTDGGITSSGFTFANASSFPVSASYMAWSSWGLSNARTQTFKYTGATNVTSNAPLILSIVANGSTALLDHSGTSGAVLRLNREITNNVAYSATLQLNVASSAGELQLGGNLNETASSTTGINKTGSGTLIMSGSSNFRGANTITSGVVKIAKKTALGTGALTISSGTRLQCTDTSTDPAKLASVGSFTSNGGRLILGS